MSFWTNEQITFLQQHLTLSPAERYRLYTDQFGAMRTLDAVERQTRRIRSAITVQDVIQSTIHEDGLPDIPQAEETEMEAASDLLREALGRTSRVLTSPARILERQAFDQFVEDLIERSKNLAPTPMPVLPNGGSSLCILLSDTHIGKHTDTFNKNVFRERILSIADKILTDIALPADLQEIVLMLAGDMLEGEDIYASQAHHLEMPVIDQVQIAVSVFWELTMRLRNRFNVPVRIEVVPGNHGRVSKMASEKSNWDNVIYQNLFFMVNVAKEPLISMNLNFDSFNVFKVQDKTGMMYHHGTKHLGTPAMQTKVAGWIYTKEFDFMCHGHWHHWEVGSQFGRLVMKNGSLPGDDDLSERMGVFDPPRQGWLLVRKGQPINQVGFFEWPTQ